VEGELMGEKSCCRKSHKEVKAMGAMKLTVNSNQTEEKSFYYSKFE
jgi:hypothetical protein